MVVSTENIEINQVKTPDYKKKLVKIRPSNIHLGLFGEKYKAVNRCLVITFGYSRHVYLRSGFYFAQKCRKLLPVHNDILTKSKK